MSKLRNKIREASQRPQRSFGFVRRDEAPSTPRVLVVAEVQDANGAARAIEAGAGALLLVGDRGAAADTVKAADGAPVGVRIDGATRDDTRALLEAGVDFII